METDELIKQQFDNMEKDFLIIGGQLVNKYTCVSQKRNCATCIDLDCEQKKKFLEHRERIEQGFRAYLVHTFSPISCFVKSDAWQQYADNSKAEIIAEMNTKNERLKAEYDRLKNEGYTESEPILTEYKVSGSKCGE